MSELFKIDGLAELELQLLDFPDKVKKTILGAALVNGCKPIQDEIKNQCPESAEAHWLGGKGTAHRRQTVPGELKKSGIKVRVLKEKESAQRLTAGI